jgi:hypothetical protein
MIGTASTHGVLVAILSVALTGCGGSVSARTADSNSGAKAGPADSSASPSSSLRYGYFFGNEVNPGGVYGVPRGGGTPVALVVGNEDAGNDDVGGAVAFDAETVYFATGSALSAIPVAGGAPVLLGTAPSGILAIALDAANAYVLVGTRESLQGSVQVVPLEGGEMHQLATIDLEPSGIAVDANYVYWTEHGELDWSGGAVNGSLSRVPLAGGTPEVLVQGETFPTAIAVGTRGVYWLSLGTPGVDCTSTDGAIRSLAPGSATPVTVVSNLASPSSLALNDAGVYWTQQGSFCNVIQMVGGAFSLANGASVARTLATGLADPGNVYVDSTTAYFTTVTNEANWILGAVAVPR